MQSKSCFLVGGTPKYVKTRALIMKRNRFIFQIPSKAIMLTLIALLHWVVSLTIAGSNHNIYYTMYNVQHTMLLDSHSELFKCIVLESSVLVGEWVADQYFQDSNLKLRLAEPRQNHRKGTLWGVSKLSKGMWKFWKPNLLLGKGS